MQMNITMDDKIMDNSVDSVRTSSPDQIPEVTASNDQPVENTIKQDSGLIYGVEDSPPWHVIILSALQQISLSLSSTIAVPIVVSTLICADHLEHARAQIISTFLVAAGISTLLQSGLGARLPILQGGAHGYLLPIMAIMNVDRFRCPDLELPHNGTNITDSIPELDETEIWQVRMREIQGAIILSSLTEVALGCTGAVGFLVYFIGPVTITCTICLIGISLYPTASDLCEQHWGIAVLTVALILLFSVYINKINFPCPSFGVTDGKKYCHISKLRIFELFPVMLAVIISWAFCGLLTGLNVFPDNPESNGYWARTDARLSSLHSSSWIFAPYPFQWGTPTVSISSYLGMISAMIAAIIESVGDYYAAARICGLPSLPPHAVNRGIALEGFGGIISGLLGSGGACTSYTQNTGAISLTKVASRIVFVWAGIMFVIAGVFGKVGALLSMMPDPVLGGVCLVGFGMVTSAGLSNLAFVDLSSSRNQVVIGVTFMIGLVIPNWFNANPEAVKTGSPQFDQTVQVMLSTPVFVGGVVAFILDNSVPGTLKERGLLLWREDTAASTNTEDKVMEDKNQKVYDIPFVTKYLKDKKWAQYVPILPTYRPGAWWEKCKCTKCGKHKVAP